MNKKELVRAVANKTNNQLGLTSDIVSATFECIMEAVANGEKIQIVDFGSFEAKNRAAKVSRNPKTGEVVNVPPFRSPAFKAGKGFKDKVNS